MSKSDKLRLDLQNISDAIEAVISNFSEPQDIKGNPVLKSAAERFVERIGESCKKGWNFITSCLGSENDLSPFREYRNNIAHNRGKIREEKLIEYLVKIKSLKAKVDDLIEKCSSSSAKLRNFENFGNLGKELDRKRLADVIKSTLEHDADIQISLPTNAAIVNYSTAIANIIQHKDLLEITKHNSNLSCQITEDITEWAESTYKQIEKENPEKDEWELWEKCKQINPEGLFKHYGSITAFLKSTYTEIDFPHKFYEREFAKLKMHKTGESILRNELSMESKGAFHKNKGNIKAFLKTDEYNVIKGKFGISDENLVHIIEERNRKWQVYKEDLKNDFLKTWGDLLLEKKTRYELKEIDERRKVFRDSLFNKIADFKKLKELLSPFIDDTKKLWSINKGVWKSIDFSVLDKYSKILRNDKSLVELSDLLGRFRDAEREYEKERVFRKQIKEVQKINYAGRSELVGIHESDDIQSVISSELSLLTDLDTEILFYKKFAEKKLLTFQYHDKYIDKIETDEILESVKVKRKNKGPFIICVDTSSSMIGTPENIAKVMCFALTKIAVREQRKCYLISFSTTIETKDLSEIGTSLDNLVAFLNTPFMGGGTDANPALRESLNVLAKREYENADVVMVSDFQIGSLSTDLINEITAQKHNGTKFFSLIVTQSVPKKSLDIFDKNWVYNPSLEAPMVSLVKDIASVSFAEQV